VDSAVATTAGATNFLFSRHEGGDETKTTEICKKQNKLK
jgi:hypothetical protein